MFRSQLSGRLYGAGVRPKRVVLRTRPRTYTNEHGLVTQGWEIVQELVIGPDEFLPQENN